jgi:L-serine dehydratase
MKFRFHNFVELREILNTEKISAPDYALKREAFSSGNSVETAAAELDRRIEVTRQALIKGIGKPQVSRSGLTRGAAAVFARAERPLVRDGLFRRAAAYALAINEVNACGGRIVSFPTAGSSGIVPGTIWAWWDLRREGARNPEGPEIGEIEPWAPPYDQPLREAFLLASLAGILIAQGATLAGSEGGCQAE